MMEELQSQKVVSLGGLNSNVNHIQLSDNEPGSAVELQNFESSLYGGYRRLSGYDYLSPDSHQVDATNAEGRILMVTIFNDGFYAARKQKSGNTYKIYSFNGASWDPITTGFTLSSVNVTRIRFKEFNFKGVQTICFVDGVNNAYLFNGTTWSQIDSADTGADYAHAGGNQAVNAPNLVNVFRNFLFIAQSNVVVYSAPLSEFNWTAAAGSGQLPVGFVIQQIMPFRDALYVFGVNNIKAVTVATTSAGVSSFVINDVTTNIGCLAPDSVVEIDGNLVFLSQDGFRPIEGTDRIGDVQLEMISKKIQQLITDEIVGNDMSELCSVLVRNKSQVRFFFSSPSKPRASTFGVIGCLRNAATNTGATSQTWEWGRLKGISAACAFSKYIGSNEYVLHGTYDGMVMRQEVGNTFAGNAVEAIYATPFLDFGAAGVRKTMRKIRLFVRPEGEMIISARLVYDWNDISKLNPTTYGIETDTSSLARYGTAVYGTSVYSAPGTPVLISNVEGSGFSVQVRYSTVDTNAPYTIQGALYDFSVEGRK
jgi:hypothetical protein